MTWLLWGATAAAVIVLAGIAAAALTVALAVMAALALVETVAERLRLAREAREAAALEPAVPPARIVPPELAARAILDARAARPPAAGPHAVAGLGMALMAAAACASPPASAVLTRPDDARHCVVVEVRRPAGPEPVVACARTAALCEWGRRRAIAHGAMAGIATVGRCEVGP